MDRRSFLASAVTAGIVSARESREAYNLPNMRMGVCTFSYALNPAAKSAFDFLEYCHLIGAGGVQAALTSLEPEYLDKVRRRSEEYGMYVEAVANLPHADATAKFEQLVVAARQAGAVCLRAACLEGRRYETFSQLDDWQRFVAESRR